MEATVDPNARPHVEVNVANPIPIQPAAVLRDDGVNSLALLRVQLHIPPAVLTREPTLAVCPGRAFIELAATLAVHPLVFTATHSLITLTFPRALVALLATAGALVTLLSAAHSLIALATAHLLVALPTTHALGTFVLPLLLAHGGATVAALFAQRPTGLVPGAAVRPRFHIAAGFRVARATDVPGCALMTGPVGSARLLMAH